MKLSTSLTESLNQHLNWNKCRMDCFIKMLMALFCVRTVNLQSLATAMHSKATINSRYRRLQRFFALFNFDFVVLSHWLFQQFFDENEKIYIAIDRTNWFWGKQKINIFMLSVLYEGVAIPIFWSMLNKAGSSNGKEQITLVNKFIEQFGKSRIIGLLGDREFANQSFFTWLKTEEIPFYIRIKSNTWASLRNKKWKKVGKLFNCVNPNQHYVFDMSVEIFNVNLFLAASRSEKGELMIIATNSAPKNAIAIYLRRWEIESLFQAFKGRGFNLENTHMTSLERISKLVGILAIGFAWAHKVGEWRAVIKLIKIKKFGKQFRPQISIFKYGLELLTDCIMNLSIKPKIVRKISELLIIPSKKVLIL
jgi:hypothetical protein